MPGYVAPRRAQEKGGGVNLNELPRLDGEEWRLIPGHADRYAASNLGRVYALPKIVRKHSAVAGRVVEQSYEGRLLQPCKTDSLGHQVVHIGFDGKRVNVAVHRLVLMAFVGPCPEGHEACHCNGDASDNRLVNLRWDSHFNNNQDRKRHGTYAVGEKHHGAKLTTEQVASIRAGTLSRADAGISKSQFLRIRRGESWGHL